jgi:hypothetical protein
MEDNSKINRILESDIAKLLKIAVFIFSVAGAYYYLQTQIALINQDIIFIKENHLKHIEERLTANESDHKEILKQVSEININIAKITEKLSK